MKKVEMIPPKGKGSVFCDPDQVKTMLGRGWKQAKAVSKPKAPSPTDDKKVKDNGNTSR